MQTMQTTQTIHPSSPCALVTGASRGIGAAIAEALAGEGYALYLTCRRSADRLGALADRLTAQYGVSCKPVMIPSLNVLVNNAGVSYIGLLHEMSADDWRQVMASNLDSLFYTCRRAVPLMLQNHSGRIVNISSVWGSVGASMETAYSASKGGVNSFTKALAKELAPSGIQVNAVACGVIDTDMNRCLTAEEMDALRSEIPADRIGQPEEAAQMVLSVLHAPAYMTGQVITLDGGWY